MGKYNNQSKGDVSYRQRLSDGVATSNGYGNIFEYVETKFELLILLAKQSTI